MPVPQPEEKQDEFVGRCVPIVLGDGTAKDQEQAVAVCLSMWEEAKKEIGTMEKVTRFSGETPWDAIVHHMSLNIEEEKAFLEFCTAMNMGTESKFPELVRTYEQWPGRKKKDMGETNEEKMYVEEMPQMVVTPPLGGATSFAELDAMIEADEVAEQIGTMAYQFREIVSNIMASDIEDKAAAVAALANEFSERMGQATKETETADKELLRYKEIEDNDSLATEDDFVGDCQVCGFGKPEVVKELTCCPFCHNEPGGETDA